MDIKVESKRLEDKIADLKVELKTWEHSFEATNGKPPSRQDIKGSKEISEKYKKYSYYKNKLSASRKPAEEKDTQPIQVKTQASKDRMREAQQVTERHPLATVPTLSPSKRSAPSRTSSSLEPATPPRKRSQLSTPTKPAMEYISPSKLHLQLSTPGKAKPNFATPKKINPEILVTPRKREAFIEQDFPSTHTPVVSPQKLVNEIGPTPQHAGKVLGILDVPAFTPFKTPTKKPEPGSNRGKVNGLDDCPSIKSSSDSGIGNEENEVILKTPAKVTVALESSTPSYFYHTVAAPAVGNSNFSDSDSDEEIGLPKKKMRLAGMIQEFKQRQAALKVDRDLDEDEEIMRELEREQEGNNEPELEAFEEFDPDSLGEFKGDDDELNPDRPEGYVAFKKKGQKRTTRRVIMRPTEVSVGGGLDDCEAIPAVTNRKPKAQPVNYKRLKLKNSGFKGRNPFFKRR